LTIKKIAKIAKVSVATVSRVLNHPELVNEETRKKVLKVIAELGYKPNKQARGLRVRRSESVGLIIPEDDGSLFTSPYLGVLLKSISKSLEREGYHFVVSTAPRDDLKIYTDMHIKGIVDGFILIDVKDEDARVDHLELLGANYIVIGRMKGKSDVFYVDSDNYTGMKEAIEYLLKTGHRDIYFVNGPSDHSVSRFRYEGYKEALKDLFDPLKVLNGNYSEEDGYNLTKEILKRAKPDAIVYSGDIMAFGGMLALREEGFNIGKDISVIGFDDVPLACLVGLSSVKQPIEEIGFLAAEMILKLMSGERVESKVLPTKLTIRASVRVSEDGF